MARRRAPVRIIYRVLVAVLIATIPVLTVGSMVVLGVGQAELRESYARQLSQIAERTAAGVDAYVFRQIIEATTLAKVPVIRAASTQGSELPLEPDAVRELDRQWDTSQSPPEALALITESTTSRFLRELVRDDPVYREIILTDRQGRLVAASGVTTDYFQADEDWWKEAFGGGVNGRVSMGDVQWDDSARAFTVDIAVPVRDPSADRVTGILKVLTDSRELFAGISGTRMGEGQEITLVRTDGTVVFSGGGVDPTAPYFAADLLRERLQTTDVGDPQSWTHYSAMGADGTQRLVAVAPSQLGVSYPNLPWLVAVSTAEAALFQPIRDQARTLLLLVAFTALAVLALTFWFSMSLAAPPEEEDVDMHLVEHPKVPHLDDAEEGAST